MKRFWTLTVLIFITSTWGFAQLNEKTEEISGQLVDSASLTPISYATIQVFKEGQNNGTGCISGLDGKFTLKIEEKADYQLIISCMGYVTVHKHISVQRDNIQLGKIRLRENDQKLSEVVITGRKKLIKLSPVGLTYNMQDDPLSKSENLLFALRNVPMVDVDGEGNIRVKGSQNYSIYLNGKPYRIATMNPKEILQSIPANTISKIEVITQPDASYDVAAGASIINIITERKQLDGYRITLNGEGETYPKTTGGASMIMTKGKVNLSLGYNYDYREEIDQPMFTERYNYKDGETVSEMKSSGLAGGFTQNHTARAMLDVEIDSINVFYADAHLLFSKFNSEIDNNNIYTSVNKDVQYGRITNLIDMNSGTSEVNLIYRNLYKKDKSERFTVGYRYTYNPDKRYNDGDEYKYKDGFESEYELLRSKNLSNGGLNEHTLQFDHVIPINESNKIRLGVKDIYRKSYADPQYKIWDDEIQNWKEGTLYGNENIGRMDQIQNIAGLYATYSFRKKLIGANIGVRAEYSHNQIQFKDSPEYNFSSNLLDFMPRCSFSYNLSKYSLLGLTYSLGVKRPSIWELNPFKSQFDEFSLSYGNPNLDSEKQHNISASYMYYTNKIFINLSLDFNRTNNAIINYFFQDTSDPKLMVKTYGNVGSHQKKGGSFYINYRPIQEVSLSANGGFTDNLIRSEVLDYKQHVHSYTAGVSCDANIPKGWLLGGRWNIFKQEPEIRVSRLPFQMYSFYVYKRFLNNDLSIGLIANQPFSKYIRSRRTYSDTNMWNRSGNDMKAPSFGIRLSYSFGSGKKAKIERDNTIQNEDLKQSTGVR